MVSPTSLAPGPEDPFSADQDLLAWLYENFKKYGDLFNASIYGTRVLVASAPDYVQHVLLENWQNYTKGQAIKRIGLLLGKGLMVSEGEFWIRQRRMVQPAFHRKAIGALQGIMLEGNRALLSDWELAAKEGRSVNVTRDISKTVLEVVLRSIFGDDYPQAVSHFSILSEQPERSLGFADAFRPLADVVIRIAQERRASDRSCADILGVLMESRERDGGGVMPDRQLAREIMTLIVAGHETTASVLNWTWYLLSQNRAAEQTLSREISELITYAFPTTEELKSFRYTRQVIEEAMRLYPPGWLMTRKALNDDALGGYFVPAGTEIYIAPYLIHRHPSHWVAPDRFDPDRFGPDQSADRHPLAMLPFSMGPRNCIGEFFARLEMQVHVMVIAQRLRLRLVGNERPELAAGVNLLSRSDFIMAPEILPAA